MKFYVKKLRREPLFILDKDKELSERQSVLFKVVSPGTAENEEFKIFETEAEENEKLQPYREEIHEKTDNELTEIHMEIADQFCAKVGI